MKCKLCGSDKVVVNYNGFIRDGKVCSKTKQPVNIYKCESCGIMFHNEEYELDQYYETVEYRKELEGTSDIKNFYSSHDFETLDKLRYTGTACYRDKVVADIGCGGGAFLDFLLGPSKEVIAIEPSEYYRKEMQKKGFLTYAYAKDALELNASKVNVVTSFDVIEHVDSPIEFLKDVYNLMSEGGIAYIGTPTDAPVMRSLLGKDYEEKLLFSKQHVWILNKESMEYAASKAGFTDISIEYKQRYGIGNLISWLYNKEPKGHVEYNMIPETVNRAFISSLEENGTADYIVAVLRK